MKNDKTGGAAFPHVSTHIARTGMTLRDYFAGQALAALAQDLMYDMSHSQAEYAYKLADAMIAEREKGGE
jgi:hypothetical protein